MTHSFPRQLFPEVKPTPMTSPWVSVTKQKRHHVGCPFCLEGGNASKNTSLYALRCCVAQLCFVSFPFPQKILRLFGGSFLSVISRGSSTIGWLNRESVTPHLLPYSPLLFRGGYFPEVKPTPMTSPWVSVTKQKKTPRWVSFLFGRRQLPTLPRKQYHRR